MSASTDIQLALTSRLEATPSIKAPVLAAEPKMIVSLIEEAALKSGVCLRVLKPVPTGFLQGNPFVFFDSADVRVQIIEWPQINNCGQDIYELIDEVALALHWQIFEGLLAHPLQLARRPVDLQEDKDKRCAEVIFNAQYQINPTQNE